MEAEQLAVYNYLATKSKTHNYSTLSALAYDERNGFADKRFIANFEYSVMNINTKEIVATVWSARNCLEWLKVVNGNVTEHYRRFPSRPVKKFENYDLQTGEVFEHYEYRDGKSIKVDAKTGEELGFSTFCTFDTLPEEYKLALNDISNKDKIFAWSDRAYGKIVYVLEK